MMLTVQGLIKHYQEGKFIVDKSSPKFEAEFRTSLNKDISELLKNCDEEDREITIKIRDYILSDNPEERTMLQNAIDLYINNTTVTNVTSTTNVTYLHPAGCITPFFVIEPLGSGKYVYYTKEGRKGIVKAQKEDRNYSLDIDGNKYFFKGKPLVKPFFKTPERKAVEEWINGNHKIKPIEKIFDDLRILYETCFDFVNQKDALIVSLSNLTSWLRDVLSAFFFCGIDATMGSGKTCLLYAMSIFSKHGSMAGDISTAFLARVIDAQKLSLGVDEIDQLPTERKSEIESILRKAQRRGNPYMRMNPKTLEPECFEVHGVHNFTFRIGIEDALKNRSFISKLRPSHDIALPVLNYYIDEISRPIFNDLFFYFMENSLRLSYAGGQVTQVTELQRGIEKELDIKERREKLFDFYTKQFTKEEVELMKLLVGRNIELAFICLTVAHLLGIKILDFIRALLIAKQSDEDIPDSFYYEKLIEFLSELYTNKKDSWTLKKGEYEGCFYYPKNSVFGEFVKWLKEKDIVHIGNSKFTGLLKDAGFIEGLNWKNQKNIKGTSIRCLIFDKDIMKKLQITDNKPLKKSLLDKWHASHYNKSELHADFLKNVFGFTDNDIEKALKNGQIMEVSPNTYKLT